MSNTTIQAVYQPQPSGVVPGPIKHKKRYPFLFLIDVSGSTGFGDLHADIHAINDAVGSMFQLLKHPPPTSELAPRTDQIDVCVVTYHNTTTTEVDWSLVPGLPASTNFKPQAETRMASALEFALDKVAERVRYYQDPANKISFGMPNIIHITDGAPTDMEVGSTRWNDLAAKLGKFARGANPEKQRANVLHFVTPNGCLLNSPYAGMAGPNGTTLTGQQALAMLTDPTTVYKLEQGAKSLHEFVKLMTVMFSSVTRALGAPTPAAVATAHVHNNPLITGTILHGAP